MENKERQPSIHDKGFDFNGPYNYSDPTEFNKIKIGVKTVEDAVLDLGALKKTDKTIFNKGTILKAIADNDIFLLRKISNYFYRTSGIYWRVCNYMAQLYRYDWYVVPGDIGSKVTAEEVNKRWIKILHYLDNSYIKKICGEIALSVVRDGCYYAYIMPNDSGLILQELPASYCRSRYKVANMPAVELNMSYFDDKFPDVSYRLKILKMFPEEIQRGYALYKQGKLAQDNDGFTRVRGYYNEANLPSSGWFLLTPGTCVKFNLYNNDMPLFVSGIPAILDLDEMQDLGKKKMAQQLVKILIQNLPMDKNGDLIFDVDEARDIHNNAVRMLSKAIGVDVLTTFADIKDIDLSDSSTSDSVTDAIKNSTSTVYNEMGISENLFNTDGNLSLEKSILTDESVMRNLLLQFNIFFDTIVKSRISQAQSSKYCFTFQMLETTQYNYQSLAKIYKEQAQMGYTKMLPQIALGLPQSSIINTIYFENEILNLSSMMVPPMLSSSMSGEDLQNAQAKISTGSGEVGRPPKDEGEKSDKTLQNLESQS